MSYFIVRCLCPHYEDYDPYGMGRNAYSGFPALWEPERHAEGALYREFKEMREQAALMQRYAKTAPVKKDDEVLIRALVGIARENGWAVKNEDAVKAFGCTAVYAIPPVVETEEMPERWVDIVRWFDRQKTKEEQAEAEAARKAEEKEAQRKLDNRIEIDYKALTEIMEDMMPDIEIDEITHLPKKNRSKGEDKVVQALVMLADESGWEPVSEQVDTAYKIR